MKWEDDEGGRRGQHALRHTQRGGSGGASDDGGY